jgi:hypothetical protein
MALILSILDWAFFALPTNAQEALTEAQIAGPREELMTYLKAEPRAQLEADGLIMPGEKIEDIAFGEPYAFYKTEPECLQKLTDYSLFGQCLVFCWWEIPVSFGGKARFRFGAYSRDGEWRLGPVGQHFVSFIEDARSQWPKSEGYRLSFVRGLAGLDFIMVEKGNTIGLYPFMEKSNKILGITRDETGRYPLLDVHYVVEKLKSHGAFTDSGGID